MGGQSVEEFVEVVGGVPDRVGVDILIGPRQVDAEVCGPLGVSFHHRLAGAPVSGEC